MVETRCYLLQSLPCFPETSCWEYTRMCFLPLSYLHLHFPTVLVTFYTGKLVITQALCYNSLSFISSWATHWLCYLWLLSYCLKVSILPPTNELWYQPHRVALKIKWANKCQDLEECMGYYKVFHTNAIFLLIFFNHIKI